MLKYKDYSYNYYVYTKFLRIFALRMTFVLTFVGTKIVKTNHLTKGFRLFNISELCYK